MGVRLSIDEAWQFIDSSHTGVVTTLRRDGFPVALPVWFVVIDREIYLRTPARSKKVARVRHDSRAGFLVESGERWAELEAVSFTARASVVDDEQLHARALELLGEKYRGHRPTRSSMPKETVQHYATTEAIVRLTPEGRLLTWDNARIALSP
jgi:PPOX class probable F420-dependent enzyme